MTLTRLKPFGARRKTYFYGVAGFVLAAHVVVGAIFRVMPPDFVEPGTIVPVEVQIIDHLLPDEVIESSAVRMVEDAPPPEEEEPPVFVPVWEPTPVAPQSDPLGPTETVLPDLVIDEVPEQPEPAPVPVVDEPAVETAPVPSVASPPERRNEPKPEAARPPVKPTKVEPRKVEPAPPAENDRVEPVVTEPEIARAIPLTPPSTGRTGILNRLRNKPDTRSRDEPYEAATWAQRPPPYLSLRGAQARCRGHCSRACQHRQPRAYHLGPALEEFR